MAKTGNQKASSPISQAIRQAGTGGITKQEVNQITKDSGKSSGAVIQKLDKINQNIKKNDGVGINLNSGAANMLIRQASKSPTLIGAAPTFGTGKIGQTLQGMTGSRASGGYINPRSGRQSMTPAVERTLLPRGMDLMPSGRQTVRGVGQQYTYSGGTGGIGPYNETNMPITPSTPGVGPGPWAPSQTMIEPIEEVIPEEVPTTIESEIPDIGVGTEFSNWASGFRRKGSSRSRGPRNARTLGGATRTIPQSKTIGM